MYLVPIINQFHTLKLGPKSKESANFFNKVWVQDYRFVPEVSRLIHRQSTCGLTYYGKGRNETQNRVRASVNVCDYVE